MTKPFEKLALVHELQVSFERGLNADIEVIRAALFGLRKLKRRTAAQTDRLAALSVACHQLLALRLKLCRLDPATGESLSDEPEDQPSR